MAPKTAKFYSYGDDSACGEVRKFIQDAGVLLDVRDISKDPFTEDELNRLIGHINIHHFLNPLSDSFGKNNMDDSLPSRPELLKLMAEDYTLLRRPIIKTARLMTVGCDKRKVAEILQISSNGSQMDDDESRGNNRRNGDRRPVSVSSGK
jgi:arsenate reductase-like glutaredoxin family protein